MGSAGGSCILPLSSGASLPWPSQVLPFPHLVPGRSFQLHPRNPARSAHSLPSLLAKECGRNNGAASHQRRSELHQRDSQSAFGGIAPSPSCRCALSDELHSLRDSTQSLAAALKLPTVTGSLLPC